jgi:hypothetical protein
MRLLDRIVPILHCRNRKRRGLRFTADMDHAERDRCGDGNAK